MLALVIMLSLTEAHPNPLHATTGRDMQPPRPPPVALIATAVVVEKRAVLAALE